MKAQKLDFNIYQFIKNSCIAVLVMGTAILFSACENNDLEKIKSLASLEDLPELEAVNFETLTTDSGMVQFYMKAPKLLQYNSNGKNSYTEFPEGILLKQYDENHKIISSITADYAREYSKEQKWEAKNNVVVVNAKGDTLKTEHLIWEKSTGDIRSDAFVKIIKGDDIILGDALVTDQHMENLDIKNPRLTIYVENQNQPKPKASTNEETPKSSPKPNEPLQLNK